MWWGHGGVKLAWKAYTPPPSPPSRLLMHIAKSSPVCGTLVATMPATTPMCKCVMRRVAPVGGHAHEQFRVYVNPVQGTSAMRACSCHARCAIEGRAWKCRESHAGVSYATGYVDPTIIIYPYFFLPVPNPFVPSLLSSLFPAFFSSFLLSIFHFLRYIHFLHCLHFDRVTSFTSFPIYLHYCPSLPSLPSNPSFTSFTSFESFLHFLSFLPFILPSLPNSHPSFDSCTGRWIYLLVG